MVRIRYTGDSTYSLREGPTFTPDDRVHDVTEEWAGQLARRARFEYADADEPEDDAESESEDATCAATTADDEPCSNPAGDDGYCHIPSHGPED